jgi:hypothetical protein
MLRVYVDGPIRFTSEMLLLAGHPSVRASVGVGESFQHYGTGGRSRLEGCVDWCDAHCVYVDDDLGAADCAVLPHKWTGLSDPAYARLNQACIRAGKLLLAFYNDDDDRPVVGLGATTILFRTSMYARNRALHPLERPLAPLVPDCYSGSLLSATEPLSVGFCGNVCARRRRVLAELERAGSSVRTNFICRNGYWAPGVAMPVARAEFLENMRSSLFVVCMRGAGNFSYRLYETLMMARIPILVHTDGMYPAAEHLACVCVRVDEAAVGTGRLVEALLAFYTAHHGALDVAQLACRALWMRCYSGRGILHDVHRTALAPLPPAQL